MCDRLIVGVTTDDLVSYKNKIPVIPFAERLEIVRIIRFVDTAIPQISRDKYEVWQKLRFNRIFVGDDWFKNLLWRDLEAKLCLVDVRIVYFPYTNGTSSTLINKVLDDLKLTILNYLNQVVEVKLFCAY